ncbi:hypothetical protein SAMN05421781_0529 [Marinococcus luteus]|uniref:Uncharacterized protein n=1 Tax=Marinococcus luteus TaxID=1122204 RepID=A0A1H2R1F7_9BACI|nr:hypothetical protein [Marinococcus luteus]SDW12509.1 hypothetical protein SAMN05421781_0529 [Marinococcus luteus]
MNEKETTAKIEELEIGLDRSSDTLENDHDVPVNKTKADGGASVTYEYGNGDKTSATQEQTNLHVKFDREQTDEFNARAVFQTNRHNKEIAGGEKPFEALYLTETGTWNINAADGKELEQNDLEKIIAYTFQSYLLE